MPQLIPPLIDAHILALIRMAVQEDLGSGDRTVELAIPQDMRSTATIVTLKAGHYRGDIFALGHPWRISKRHRLQRRYA